MKHKPSMTMDDEIFGDLYYPWSFENYLEYDLKVKSLTPEEKWEAYRTYGISPTASFFADDQVFEIFEKIVFPKYSAKKIVNIASVGCSNGKEAYSLLLVNWKQRERMRLDAFDINPENIATAISGEYDAHNDGRGFFELCELKTAGSKIPNQSEAFSFVGMDEKFHDHSHVIFTEEAKKNINFSIHDIVKEKLPQKYDIILLVNVLHHFTEKGRERILSNIHESMYKGGWLLCEESAWRVDKYYNEIAKYAEQMGDLKRLGFEKQKIIIQQPLGKKEDLTKDTQIYRKSSLK